MSVREPGHMERDRQAGGKLSMSHLIFLSQDLLSSLVEGEKALVVLQGCPKVKAHTFQQSLVTGSFL